MRHLPDDGRLAISVRLRQLDHEIAEGPCLTRQERAFSLLRFRQNRRRAAAVVHAAGDQTHLAGATTAAAAAEHDLGSGAHDGGQNGLSGTTGYGVAERAEADRVATVFCETSAQLTRLFPR